MTVQRLYPWDNQGSWSSTKHKTIVWTDIGCVHNEKKNVLKQDFQEIEITEVFLTTFSLSIIVVDQFTISLILMDPTSIYMDKDYDALLVLVGFSFQTNL